MKKYRIIEKKGEYKEFSFVEEYSCYDHFGVMVAYNCNCKNKLVTKKEYTPKYTVQEICKTCEIPGCLVYHKYMYMYKDLKDFNDLDEARKYKRDLELDDGIIIE